MTMAEIVRATTNPAFRFVVEVGGTAVAAFTECTLPVIEWETEEVKEGGLNTYTHVLPGRRKRATLTLKNGVGLSKEMVTWYTDAMKEQFTRKKLAIKLMSAPGSTVITWTIESCIPTKWTGPQLKSSDNTIAIQTLELACGHITCETNIEPVTLNPNNKELIPAHVTPKKLQRAPNPNNKSLIPPHQIPPKAQRAPNPNNKQLIPQAAPAAPRATNPNDTGLIPATAPKAPRATNPSNKELIPPHKVAPDKQRVKSGSS